MDDRVSRRWDAGYRFGLPLVVLSLRERIATDSFASSEPCRGDR
jgi:hypothetical protein